MGKPISLVSINGSWQRRNMHFDHSVGGNGPHCPCSILLSCFLRCNPHSSMIFLLQSCVTRMKGCSTKDRKNCKSTVCTNTNLEIKRNMLSSRRKMSYAPSSLHITVAQTQVACFFPAPSNTLILPSSHSHE